MKIEDVEKLEALAKTHDYDEVSARAIPALRAEAWHPIEKAEELGAKGDFEEGYSGAWVLGCDARGEMYVCRWFPGSGEWRDRTWPCEPTRFRFINPPENRL